MNSLSEIARVLAGSRQVILGGHVMPDGDSLGATAALGLALESAGKRVVLASPDPVPETYDFLPGAQRFRIGEAGLDGDYDLFVALDCSVPDRLGVLQNLLLRPELTVVGIDHHAGGEAHFARYFYVDPQAAATGEIIFDLLELMRLPITPEIAACLYTALVTDTGSFRYQNTTPATHRRAARLIELGADAPRLNTLLFSRRSLIHLRLLQNALATLAMSLDGRVAWMHVTLEMMENLGAKEEHTDGLIDYVRSIRGVEVAVIFRETAPGQFKIGFRSKERVDVHRLAAMFGGGGHVRASGAVVRGEAERIIPRVIAAAEGAVRRAWME